MDPGGNDIESKREEYETEKSKLEERADKGEAFLEGFANRDNLTAEEIKYRDATATALGRTRARIGEIETLLGMSDEEFGNYHVREFGNALGGVMAAGMAKPRAPTKTPPTSLSNEVSGLSQQKIVPKSIEQQAADLISQNANRNRVTLRSPSLKLEVDLAGKAHGNIPTPHTKVSPRNYKAPNQPAYNTKNSPVQPATQEEIRTLRRYLESLKKR